MFYFAINANNNSSNSALFLMCALIFCLYTNLLYLHSICCFTRENSAVIFLKSKPTLRFDGKKIKFCIMTFFSWKCFRYYLSKIKTNIAIWRKFRAQPYEPLSLISCPSNTLSGSCKNTELMCHLYRIFQMHYFLSILNSLLKMIFHFRMAVSFALIALHASQMSLPMGMMTMIKPLWH